VDSDSAAPSPEFETLGWYSPRDAERLLNAFEEAGVPYQTEVSGGAGSVFVQTDRGLIVSVEAKHRQKAYQLHTELFGDASPNFDSAFFREHPPEITPDTHEQV
jgi:hypothetical protein